MSNFAKNFPYAFKSSSFRFTALSLAALAALSGCASMGSGVLGKAGYPQGYLPIQVDGTGGDLASKIPLAKLSNASRQVAFEGVKALDKRDFKKASDLFNLALKTDINNSYLHLLNALAYHYRALDGESALYGLAEQGYEQAVQFDGSNWLARHYMGMLYMDRRDYALAQHHLMEAALYNPDDNELLYDLATAAYYAKDLKTAFAALQGISDAKDSKGGQSTHTARAKAIVAAALGDTEAAQKHITTLAQGGSSDTELNFVKKRTQSWAGMYKDGMLKTQFTTGGGAASQPGGGRPGNSSGGFPSGQQGGFPAGQQQNQGGQGYGQQPVAGLPGTPRNPGDFVEKQMVTVDVVIISAEEDNGNTMGVNLLEGLKVQFGNSSGTPAWSRSRTSASASDSSGKNSFNIDGTFNNSNIAGAITANSNSAGANNAAGANSFSSGSTGAITRLISIPGISYSLNIANARERSNEVLARPTLVALGGQTSQFFSGTDVVGAAVSAGQGSSVQIQKEVGVKLAVTPEFLPDNLIKMQVLAERTFLTNPNSNVVFDFRLDTTKTIVSANVTMRFGETIILSGLSERDKGIDNSGVPGLRDIPVVQYLFSRKAERDYHKSVLILLTPRRPQYTNRSAESIAEERAKFTEFDRVQAEFEDKFKLWFKPIPNTGAAISNLQDNALFREVRTGDIELSNWISRKTHSGRVRSALDFLFY
jgi:Flp pilus assembly protein TadD